MYFSLISRGYHSCRNYIYTHIKEDQLLVVGVTSGEMAPKEVPIKS